MEEIAEYVPMVKRLASHMMRKNPNRPNWLEDEMVSEGLHALWLAWEHHDEDKGTLYAWLYIKVKYAMLDVLRQKYWTYKFVPTAEDYQDLPEKQQTYVPFISPNQENAIERLTLEKLLSTLNERERRILEMYFWENWNLYEIADLMGRSESLMSVMMKNALVKLRRCVH